MAYFMETGIIGACYSGKHDVLKYLLKKHNNPNVFDIFGKRVLVCCILLENFECAQILIEKQSSITEYEIDSNDLLFYCDMKKSSQVCYFLHKNVSNTQIILKKDKEGRNILHCALMKGDTEMINILKHYSFDVDSLCNKGNNYLHYLNPESNNAKEIFLYLYKEKQVDLFQENNNGEIPFDKFSEFMISNEIEFNN